MSYAAFWTASTDGSSWYRADQPAAALGWRGHQTWVGEVLPASVVAKASVIVGSRVARPEALQAWGELKDQGKRLVLDLDDDYFGVEERNAGAYEYWCQPDIQANLREACRLADVVTVASDRIGERVAGTALNWSGSPEIKVIENGLHAGHLSVPRDYEADNRPLVIGWAGTSATVHDLDLVIPALVKIMQYAPTAELHLIGIPRAYPGLKPFLPFGDRIVAFEWLAPTELYHQAVRQFDIWVAPYRANSFTEAKFPTKALEAGMMGIPLIASDIAPYREWAAGAGEVLLVRDHQPWSWSANLKMLVDSAAGRRAMGEAGRARASRNILQSIGAQWEEVLFG
jgi:glycosyltransferase involved in cell wall biosynthesis